MNQTAPSTALDVLHHQHAEGGSGHSGTVFVACWNVWSHDRLHLKFNFISQICTDYHDGQRRSKNSKAPASTNVAERLVVAGRLAYKYSVAGWVLEL